MGHEISQLGKSMGQLPSSGLSIVRRAGTAAIALLIASALLSVASGCRSEERVAKRVDKKVALDAGVTAPVAVAPRDQGPPKRLFARRFVVKLRTAPNKDAFRAGYLRGGAVLMAKTDEPIGFDQCRKGWFELETGGFVCSTVDVTPFLGKRLPERRTLQPDLAALLPYPYGYSRRKRTPMYRRLPTDEELALHEGLTPPVSVDANGLPTAVVPVEPAAPAVPQPSEVAPAPSALLAGASDPIDEAGAPASGEGDGGVPTLASLMGDQTSVLMRRMERGFYVSLDRDITRGGRKYFRTQSNGFIPFSAIVPVKPSAFQGADLSVPSDGVADPEKVLPLAWVMSKDHFAYAANKTGKLRPAKKPGYHYRFHVTGTVEQGGTTFLTAADGQCFRTRDVTRLDAREKPPEVGNDEKWLDINLSTQTLVAYVGSKPVYATLVSTGRIKDELDPLKNFETPSGMFRITSKHLSATMDGDHALDGPYSIEDVPYVMYFQLAYALHAAFWHNGFGRPRSHGCINLAPADAKFVFNFIEPFLPVPWHGVYPLPDTFGTRLYIHGKTPEG